MKNYILFTMTWLIFSIQPISASTFKVTNTNDSGPGSLREAIQFANSNFGADDIIFDIPGTAPHTIMISGSLPPISDQLILDGTTQPANGFNGLSPKIIIDGGPSQSTNGLRITANNSEFYGIYLTGFKYRGLVVSGNQCIIGSPTKRNVFSGNEYDQLEVSNAVGGLIQGNFIGTDTSGTKSGTPPGEGYNGISLEGAFDITIEGNLISGNNYNGISLTCAKNNFIFNNKIGTDIKGNVALPNRYDGISLRRSTYTYCTSENNVIGEIGKGNLISGNEYNGINLNCASNNTVFNNIIGMDINGAFTIPNEYFGIDIEWDSYQILNVCTGDGNVIGDLNKGNLISGNDYGGIHISCSSNNSVFNNKIGTDINGNGFFPNGGNGINIQQEMVFSSEPECITENNLIGGNKNENIIANNLGYAVSIVGSSAINNKVTQNRIYCNTQGINLQDIYSYGVGPGNDDNPAPIITSASSNSVSGTATPNDTIEVFGTSTLCTKCQGDFYFGSTVADAAGNWVFSGNLSGTIVTTATSPTGNTSRFSLCSPLSTSTKDIDTPEISWSVYPNPVENGRDIIISFENIADDFNDLKLEMYDVLGRLVHEEDVIESDAIRLDTKDYSAGMYLISLKRDQAILELKKVVIK